MSVTSTEKKRRFVMFALLGLAVAAVIVVGSMMLFAPKKPPASATLATARTDAVKGQAGGEGSEEYNKKLEAHGHGVGGSRLHRAHAAWGGHSTSGAQAGGFMEPAEALRRLAARFPGGSAKSEVERRRRQVTDQTGADDVMVNVIQEIVNEIANAQSGRPL